MLRVASFTSCTVIWFGSLALYVMHNKVTEVFPFSLIIHNYSGLLAAHNQVFLACRGRYFPFLDASRCSLEVALVHVMHCLLFLQLFKIVSCVQNCPFFASGPHDVQRDLPLYIKHVDMIWELPLFTSSTLKCLEISVLQSKLSVVATACNCGAFKS